MAVNHRGSSGQATTGSVPCELAWAVARGDSSAIPALLRVLHPRVSGYCRARAHDGGIPFVEADRIALDACRTVLAELSSPTGANRNFATLVYEIASAAVDSVSTDTAVQLRREVLILRTIVGLDPEQTAAVLSISPGRVRLEQHAALQSFRVA
ncbi:RNA polymerase subunit sigma-24 [Rhodococcus sp. O3]|uniref:RNA polymerase subunit sigma-24 n=1 Tax=Rhodococcus sp. O3 TaxID=3404919 RepID=UPI003B675A6C